jgi:glucose/arabinose dehydrogenase
MRYLLLTAILTIAACGDGATDPSPGVQAVQIADGLVNPLHLTAPAGDDRLFVVEQAGRIRIIRDGALLAEPFLDVSASVNFRDEGGLLGLAFDPEYATTGRFWVNYTQHTDGATVVQRYVVSDDPDVADPQSAQEVLRIAQPTWSHNGGQLEFGPDGMLYIGVGDGGEYEDPQGHSQDPNTLLGTLLRIDVRAADTYAIPQDNPFSAAADARPEVWAYGLRNPWRFAFDAAGGMLYVTDVGQHEWEEINAVAIGAAPVNYGWSVMEGSHCFNADTCDTDGLTDPVLEYSHDDGCSVIGGHIYRGSRLTGLQGHYFFGDYCQGWVHSLRMANDAITDRRDWKLGFIGHILGFGEDAVGELYVLTTTGSVYRLDAK